MKAFNRSRQVGNQVQRELARLIREPVHDAGLGLVTVTYVSLSPDLMYAKVFITYLGNKMEAETAMTMLNGLAGRLRWQLAKRLTTKVVPKLQFSFDESLSQSNRLTDLIDSLLLKENAGR